DAAFLVQEFVADGAEVFFGVSRDPDFGLSLAFGMGGVAIELLRCFGRLRLPLRDGDAEAMIAETRGAALLGAVRGGAASDVKSLATCLYALADFAWHHAGSIAEIDLNPIKVLPENRGCVVVDALIVIRPADNQKPARPQPARCRTPASPVRAVRRRRDRNRRRAKLPTRDTWRRRAAY